MRAMYAPHVMFALSARTSSVEASEQKAACESKYKWIASENAGGAA